MKTKKMKKTKTKWTYYLKLNSELFDTYVYRMNDSTVRTFSPDKGCEEEGWVHCYFYPDDFRDAIEDTRLVPLVGT